MKHKILKMVQNPEKTKIGIFTPYDEDLLQDIHQIPSSERDWNGQKKVWIIDIKHLEYVHNICYKAAEEKNWTIQNFIDRSKAEIQQQITDDLTLEIENHIKAVGEVLPKLPQRCLQLVRWTKDRLQLQLQYHLGDSNLDLFQDLYNASLKAWKPKAIASWNQKLESGFVFEFAADPRIIRELQKYQIRYLETVSLSPLTIFDEEIAHLTTNDGEVFLGIQYEVADMDSISMNAQSWEIAVVNKVIYWVISANKYFDHKIRQPTQVLHIGKIGHPLNNSSDLPNFLKVFHAEALFSQWANTQLSGSEVTCNHPSKQWKIASWSHPADLLMIFINQQFKQKEELYRLMGLNPKKLDPILKSIKAIKASKAEKARKEALDNLPQLVIQQFSDQLKTDLQKTASRYGVYVKKSWSKTKLCEEISQKTEAMIALFDLNSID